MFIVYVSPERWYIVEKQEMADTIVEMLSQSADVPSKVEVYALVKTVNLKDKTNGNL